MSQEVSGYIDNLGQAWQAELCRSLHQTVHQAIPEVADRLQYGKPHYPKNGKYACALGTAKGWVTLTIFNAAGLDAPEGLFEPGPPERKTIKIRQGQAVDHALLAKLLRQAASTI
jgi:hypothetical protein